MKKFILIIIVLSIFACDDNQQKVDDQQKVTTNTDIAECKERIRVDPDFLENKKLVWDTDGGGDLHFTVLKQENNFIIERSGKNFSADYAYYVLTPETEETKKIYQSLSNIFSKSIPKKTAAPAKDSSEPPVAPPLETGTWRTVKLCSNDDKDCFTIKNADPNLYDFVNDLVSSKKCTTN